MPDETGEVRNHHVHEVHTQTGFNIASGISRRSFKHRRPVNRMITDRVSWKITGSTRNDATKRGTSTDFF